MSKLSKKRKIMLSVQCIGCVLILVLAIVANSVAVYWSEPLTQLLGVTGAKEGAGTSYFVPDYQSQEDALAASDALVEEVVAKGAVLLKNEGNVLPLEGTQKVTLLGTASYSVVMSGSGSGSSNMSNAVNFKAALEEVGYSVNPTLWDFYGDGAGKEFGTGSGGSQAVGGLNQRIAEVPVSLYSKTEKDSFRDYSDAAIVVIGRSGSEGVDLSRNLASLNEKRPEKIEPYEDGQHYLELSQEEKDLFRMASENFSTVIAIINSPNAMELGFVEKEEYGIDAVLWIGAVGQSGTRGVADILSGKANPSGRLVDTYVYDNFSSPASANIGDYRYGTENYFYVSYSEGIYVGYKYYETRYEDKVLGRDHVGEYDYAATVQYPFGFGLSYTDFTWSGFNAVNNEDTVTVSVDISNAADGRDGAEVVELYVGAPYTAGGVEKAAVSLCGFQKLEVPKGSSKTAEITVDKKALASYDAYGAGTYVLEAGDYYITAAHNAHEAMNNILAAKAADGAELNSAYLAGEGDAAFVTKFTVAETEKYDEMNGVEIENRFDDVDLTKEACPAYDASFRYLSRSDWEGTFPVSYSTGKNSTVSNNLSGFVETRPASDGLLQALNADGYAASGNPAGAADYQTVSAGKAGKRELVEMVGKDFDDESWDELLDQMTIEEMTKIVESSGYKTGAIESVKKPKTYDFDGPAGLTSFFTAVHSSGWPVEAIMAATWDVELLEKVGTAIGNEALFATESGRTNGINGWYAPGMNIHRSPFSGRNFEYYSEDPFLSGTLGSAQIKGVQSKGVYCYMKHFALNDQESNRSCSGNDGNGNGGRGLVTWSNEQAIREIYLKPFEIAIKENKDNGALAVMTSFNRIGARWAGGNYNLITGVLRNEWGFNGFVITDYWEGDYMNGMQMLGAGGDAMLISAGNNSSRVKDTDSNMTKTLLRNGMKHILYTVVNSSAMNGATVGASVNSGIPNYVFILIAVDIIAAAGIAALVVFAIKGIRREFGAANNMKKH